MLSPKIEMEDRWFEQHSAYTISKYALSMLVFGLAAELKEHNIAVNALWPRTTIATAAIQNLLGGEKAMKMSRWPEVVSDAAYYILSQDPDEATGQFYMDEEVLERYGITDLKQYAVDLNGELANDLFVKQQ
jgi:citronellol/citronellal dehydrogenase